MVKARLVDRRRIYFNGIFEWKRFMARSRREKVGYLVERSRKLKVFVKLKFALRAMGNFREWAGILMSNRFKAWNDVVLARRLRYEKAILSHRTKLLGKCVALMALFARKEKSLRRKSDTVLRKFKIKWLRRIFIETRNMCIFQVMRESSLARYVRNWLIFMDDQQKKKSNVEAADLTFKTKIFRLWLQVTIRNRKSPEVWKLKPSLMICLNEGILVCRGFFHEKVQKNPDFVDKNI